MSIVELREEKQCVLKEINEVLSLIITEIEELNQLTDKDGTFMKSIENANQHIESFKKYMENGEMKNLEEKDKSKKDLTEANDVSVEFIPESLNGSI